MSSKLILYTKDNCSHCVNAKKFLDTQKILYVSRKVGEDVSREEFLATYPMTRTLPFALFEELRGDVTDETLIGGYIELVNFVNKNRSMIDNVE